MWWWKGKGAGVVEKSLLDEYGTLARWNGALGVSSFHRGQTEVLCFANMIIQEDRLWIADPKAIQHIVQVSYYQCEKNPHLKPMRELLIDRGLISVEGESIHALHAVKPSNSE